jgi:hypothetical protein
VETRHYVFSSGYNFSANVTISVEESTLPVEESTLYVQVGVYNVISTLQILLCTLNSFSNAGVVIRGDFNMILDHIIDCWPPRVSTAVNVNLKLFM